VTLPPYIWTASSRPALPESDRASQTAGYTIVAIDKHPANVRILCELHPDIRVVEVNLADSGDCERELDGANSGGFRVALSGAGPPAVPSAAHSPGPT